MADISILVLGFGELGEEVVKSLANRPKRCQSQISVMLRSRKPDQVTRLKEWNVNIFAGDVVQDSLDKLADIFGQFHTVICCVGMYAPPDTQPKIAAAVLAGGVKRYFPWQFGLDYDAIGRNSSQDLFDSQLDVRDMLRGQNDTQWVIVSTGMFVSFLFEPAFGIVNSDRNIVTGLGSWENEITVTSPEDIGRVVADIAIASPDCSGVVYTSGDTISMRELANVVAKITGNEVKRSVKTVDELQIELKGDPTDSMKKYRVVFAQGVGTSWKHADSFNAVHGIPTQNVEEWAKVRLA